MLNNLRCTACKHCLRPLLFPGVSMHRASRVHRCGTADKLLPQIHTIFQLPAQGPVAVSTWCLHLVPCLVLDGPFRGSHPEAELPHGIWVPRYSIICTCCTIAHKCICNGFCKLRRWIQSMRNRMTKSKRKAFTHVVVKKKKRPDGSMAVSEP